MEAWSKVRRMACLSAAVGTRTVLATENSLSRDIG